VPVTSPATWTSAVWRTEDFRSELRGFVADALGEDVTLEALKVRPWSTVWRVGSSEGTFYAKQNCPGQGHETRLVVHLAAIAPEQVVPVVAADPARDLLLTADLGPTVHAEGRSEDVDVWCRIVVESAQLQQRLVPLAERLLLTRLTPEDATTYLGDAIGRLSALPAEDPRRMDADLAERLRRLLPTVEAWADQLADLDLPLTLNHNDLHDDNVVATDDDRPLRFFDFGDAVLTEPLGNLLVPLNVCADLYRAAPDDPRLRRVADAALEVWSDLAPMSELRAALPAALQLARLARVESWRRCVASMTPDERGEFGAIPAGWLGSLLEDPPVGTLPRM